MRIPIALALLFLPSGAALAAPGQPAGSSQPLPGSRAYCPGAPQTHWAGPGDKAAARKLNELPPGKLILTVQREVNGCPEEAVVRTNIGATSFETPRARR
jgi:hypothetical protein